MANARMCDRCGECFNPMGQDDKEMVRFQNPVFQTSKSIKTATVCRRLINDHPDAWIDLCPKCTTAFEFFMKNFDIAGKSGSFEEEVDQ